MVWTNIQNDPCDSSWPTDATQVMGNFQYRLQTMLPLNAVGAETDNTYDLGSPAFRFRNLYLGGDIIMANATRVHANFIVPVAIPAGVWQDVIFNIEDYDLINDYDPLTGVLTAQDEGYYEINSVVNILEISVMGLQIAIFINGILYSTVIATFDTNAVPMPFYYFNGNAQIQDRVYLTVGNTLQIKCRNISPGGRTLENGYINIIRRVVY